MKICFAIGTLSYSGAEKIMYHLIHEFINIGDEVSVILLSCEKKYEDLKGIVQYPIYNEEEKIKNRVIRTLKREKRIRNIIRENNFDVIVSFGVIFNVDIAEACMFEKVKLILCERNDPLYDPHSKLYRLRRGISYHRGDGFVFQTKEIKEFFTNRIQKKSIVIPNFIERTIGVQEMYSPQRDVLATSARLDNRQKDQITLLKAFAKFHESHESYYLEFYGDGPDKELLEKYACELNIAEYVRFLGRVSNPMKYIRECKAFILSSIYEGMPNALIEAMSYGMPCISSDCSGGGAKALIHSGNNGLIYNVGDVDSLVEAMCLVCDDEDFATEIGKEAYKVNDTLKMDKIIDAWNLFIKMVVEGQI